MNLLSIKNLFSETLLGDFALQNISLQQQPLQNLAIIGQSGSGKTTLLKTIAGLMQPKAGTIIFNNEVVKGPNWQLVGGQKGIAYLSQQYELHNNYRMEELLQYNQLLPQQEADEIYEICHVKHVLKRNSYQLSGGEKQRIALATLLLQKPQLLILDEPFSNLDLIHKKILKTIIENVCNKYEISCILSSHDPLDVLPWAQKIIVLFDGKKIQEGDAWQIYKKPVNTYVAGLLGSYNQLNNDQKKYFNTTLDFIRPEKLHIISPTHNNFKGTVTSCTFYGSYYEYIVTYLGANMIIHQQENSFTIGDTVSIILQQ